MAWAQSEGFALRVLGPVATASVDEPGSLTPLRGQQGEVLSVLAAAYPDPVRTDAIITSIWSDTADQKSRRTGLGVVIHRLRDRLGTNRDSIVNEAGAYRLSLENNQLDHLVFVSEVDRAETELANDDAAAADRLTAALALWRGDCFEPFSGNPLVTTTAQYLGERRREAQETLLEALLRSGRHDDAATWATQFVETEPFRERRWELLMLALYRSGRQAEALHAAKRVNDLLVDNLGVSAGPAIRKLEVDILNQEPSLDGPSPEPQEVGLGQFVRSLGRASRRTPVATNRFVGRAAELRSLAHALETERIVTIVGPPGAGKSRVAAQHAGGSTDEQVVWIDLAALNEDALVPELIRKLGVMGGGDEAAAICNALDQQPTLLVFDNAERLRGPVGELAEGLSSNCSNLSVLATSQVALATPNEVTMSVGPLEPAEAKRLLISRAFGADEAPDLPTGDLDELIEQLDAMPLHLELVAASLRTTPPAVLVSQLRTSLEVASSPNHGDGRHRSLDNTLNNTLELLPSDACDLYEVLGVFNGAFSLADVAELTNQPVGHLRPSMTTLAEHFLVTADHESPNSYRQSASMRTHARGRLASQGRLDQLQERHATHYFDLLQQARTELRIGGEEAMVARLRPISDQLRTAHRWFIEQKDAARSATFAINMWEYSFLRQNFEQYSWPSESLELPGVEDLDNYVELLGVAAFAAWARNDYVASSKFVAQAEQSATDRKVPVSITALRAQFNVAAQTGRFDTAAEYLEKTVVECHRQKDDHETFITHVSLALGHAQLGDTETAQQCAQSALDMAEASGSPSNVSWANFAQGSVLLPTKPDQAARFFSASSRLARLVDNQWVHGMASTALVTCLRHQGRTQQAFRLLGEVLDVWGRAQNASQVARAGQELVVMLHSTGAAADAATALAHVDLLDQIHPLLPEAQKTFDELREDLQLADVSVERLPVAELAAVLGALVPAPGAATNAG